MDEESKRDWKMRKMGFKDVFPMSRILKKMNLKLNTKSGVLDENGKDIPLTQTEVGVNLILSIVENLHLAQDEVNEFLGGLVGISGKEFNELDLEDGMTIIALFKEQRGIGNFLKQAAGSTK